MEELTEDKLKKTIRDIFEGMRKYKGTHMLLTNRTTLIDILLEKFDMTTNDINVEEVKAHLDPHFLYRVTWGGPNDIFEIHKIVDGEFGSESVPQNIPNLFEWYYE